MTSSKIKISKKHVSVVSFMLFVAGFAFVGLHLLFQTHADTGAPLSGTQVCGQSILNSPYSYSGNTGTTDTTFTSGEYGLPTFGSAGTNFPTDTSGVIIPAGNNTTAAQAGTYQVNNTIFYLEPGSHTIQTVMYSGVNDVYVGGYNSSSGEATINGVNGATVSGNGGNYLSLSTNNVVNSDQTWEYLTIENYAPGRNGAVLGNEQGEILTTGILTNTTPSAQITMATMVTAYLQTVARTVMVDMA